MRTPVNFFLSGTSIGLGASDSLLTIGGINFGRFLPWWVHGVISDGGQRTISNQGCTCNSPLKVATYVFIEVVDVK